MLKCMKRRLQQISRYIKALPECATLLKWLIFKHEILVPTFGSYGDLLMVNGVLREYSKIHNRKLRIVFKNAILSYNLPFIRAYLSAGPAYYIAVRLAPWFRNIRLINYGLIDEDKERHLMQRIAQRLGFELAPGFAPYYVVDEEKDTVPLPNNHGLPLVALQSTAKVSFTSYKNWIPGRMEAVATGIGDRGYRIQLGTPDDLPLPVDRHYQGQLSIRQSLYLLSKVQLFIGLEGALMHGAKALNVPTLVVFGGYIHPQNSGYPGTTGIKSSLPCAPCLKTAGCQYNHRCMKDIEVEQVQDHIKQLLPTASFSIEA